MSAQPDRAAPPPPARAPRRHRDPPADISSDDILDQLLNSRGQSLGTRGPTIAPAPAPYPAYDTNDEPRRRGRSALAPRVGVLVIAGALITGGLAVAHRGPFHSAPRDGATHAAHQLAVTDIRGTWHAVAFFGGAFQVETMHITVENLHRGSFSGTLTTAVGVETLKGTILDSTMAFTITFGISTDSGSATVTKVGGQLHLQGSFSNTTGGHGTITASRTPT